MDVEVSLGATRYPYRLGHDWLDRIVDRLHELAASRYLVVCDSNTGPLYGANIRERLSRRAKADLLVHPAGEPHKHVDTVGSLMEEALRLRADRSSVIVAVGGGITGNIAGLVAALLFRGIRLVHVPTSLIGMLDSVLSLKQAVNASVGKNLVGTFYPPVEVLADTAMLRTLEPREVTSGLCEAVKNSLAIRPGMTGLLRDGVRPDGTYDEDVMLSVIAESVRAKAQVTVDDERECRAGLVLEYGHTVGHALEYTAGGALSHGEAVGLGMVAAAEVAHRRGHLDAGTVALHRELLRRAGAAVTIPSGIDLDEALRFLRYDNKRGYLDGVGDDTCAMILLRGHGLPVWENDRPLVPVPMTLVAEVLQDMIDGTAPDAGVMATAVSGDA